MRALVVGASGDMGSAVARELARQGLALTLHGHTNERRLLDLADEVGARDTVLADLRQEADVRRMAKEVGGPLDALAYCAGVNVTAARLAELPVRDWEEIFAVNVRGAYLVLRELLPALRQAAPGRAVFVSSIFGSDPPEHRVAYAASKAALNALVKGVAREEGAALLVNAVAPSAMWSESVREIFRKHVEADGEPIDEYIRTRQSRNPQSRFVEPEECAELVAFLAGPGNRFVSGQTIAVDGGET